VPLVLTAALLVGCGTQRPIATPTPTHVVTAAVPTVATTVGATPPSATPTSIRTATPSPAPTPILAWDVPPKTGLAHLDAIITAMVQGDSSVLETYVVGFEIPCRADPSCAPGARITVTAAGGIVGSCVGDWTYLLLTDDPRAPYTLWPPESAAGFARVAANRWFLRSVSLEQPGTPGYIDEGVRYRIAFQRAQASADVGIELYVTDRGLVRRQAWLGARCAPEVTAAALIAPPRHSP